MNRPAISVGEPFGFEMPVSLAAALRQAIAAHPEGGFTFIDAQHHATAMSYAQVWQSALRRLAGLRAAGLRPGDALILDADPPQDFIPTLWAAMLGGIVAVPLSCSRWNAKASREFRDRLERVAGQLGGAAVVSDDPELFRVGTARPLSCRHLEASSGIAEPCEIDREAVAVLISTSGTTGHSQLVRLSGRAVMHRWWPSGPADGNERRFLGWMPMDHVMGLGLAGPNNRQKIHLAPEAFVREPVRWLERIEQHRVTHAGITNFSMRLISEAVAHGGAWDLSSLQRIGIGAEAIDPKTCVRFARDLMRFGMPEDALILGYGLSECGPVAGGLRAFRIDDAPDAQRALPIDRPTQGHSIRIVDEAGHLCNELQVGRIEVRGPTMASGYHGDPEGDARLFTADGWLRTGDLGLLDQGCLTVTGREKEVLIVNARKYACSEIDAVVGRVPGIKAAHVFAAKARDGAGESVALAYVPDGSVVDSKRLESALRRACSETFGFGLARCLRVDPGQLPRTPSGKLQRHRLAESLGQAAPDAAGDAGVVADATLEGRLRAIMARFLPGARPEPDDDFFELGGDSLGALMFVVAVESELKVALPPAVFARHPSCRMVARYLACEAAPPGRVLRVDVQPGRLREGLFLAPGVWGKTAYAVAFGAALGEEFPVRTFHLSDPGDRSLQMRSLEEFAAECCRSLREAQAEGPYHLAGHSFGGLLAFEMARQLRAQGDAVGSLCIIDASPCLDERHFAAAGLAGGDSLIRHHRNLVARYLAGPIDCRIRYFRASDDHALPLSDPSGGWSYLTTQGVECFEIPGDHYGIVRGRSLALLAGRVADAMRGEGATTICRPAPLSDDARALIEAARSAAVAGDLPAEIAALTRLVREHRDLPFWVHSRVAEAMLAARRPDVALRAYRAALTANPWPLSTHLRFCERLAEFARPELAQFVLRAARATPVDSTAAAYTRARVCMALGDPAESEHSLRLGLDRAPASLRLRTLLVRVLALTARGPEAAGEIERALAEDPDSEVGLLTLGIEAVRLGQAALAVRCLNRCLAIDASNPEALELLGRLHAARGDAEAAADHARRAKSILAERAFR